MRPPPPPPRRPKQPQPGQPAREPRPEPPAQRPAPAPAAPPAEEEGRALPKRPAPAAQEPAPAEAPPQEQPPPEPEPPADPEPGHPAFTPGNPAHRRFKTGATPTPPDKREAAPKFRPPPRAAAVTRKAWIPPRLSVWGNDQYPDCVSASEAFAKACHAPELLASDQEVIDWARAHDALNGAYLPEVMDQMARDGMVISGSDDPDPWKDGPYRAVDFHDEEELRAAIAEGPVKIGIMSSALPADAGARPGWFALTPGPRGREDHCVEVAGFGPAGWLFDQLGVPLPVNFPADQGAYLLFTWGTIGVVSHSWLAAACGEAWVREPTTVEHAPAPEPPQPPEPPAPPPAPEGPTLTLPADLPAGTYTLTPAGDAASAGSVTIPAGLVQALRALLCPTKGEGEGHDSQ